MWAMNARQTPLSDSLLEQLAQEGQVRVDDEESATEAPAPQRLPGKAIAKVRYSHDAMIDQIVANPAVSQNQLAAVFGYTPAWVSLVMSSDAFKERLAARKEELVDPVIRASLEERFKALVTRSLEVLQEKLALPSSTIPDNLALRAAELGAKALGIGGNAPPPPPTIPSNHLDMLANRLVALQRRVPQGEIYEIETVEEIRPASPVQVGRAS